MSKPGDSGNGSISAAVAKSIEERFPDEPTPVPAHHGYKDLPAADRTLLANELDNLRAQVASLYAESAAKKIADNKFNQDVVQRMTKLFSDVHEKQVQDAEFIRRQVDSLQNIAGVIQRVDERLKA